MKKQYCMRLDIRQAGYGYDPVMVDPHGVKFDGYLTLEEVNAIRALVGKFLARKAERVDTKPEPEPQKPIDPRDEADRITVK